MRAYLLLSLLLTLVLPLITLPGNWFHSMPGSGSIDQPINFAFFNLDSASSSAISGNASLEGGQVSIWSILVFLLMGIYMCGALHKLYLILRKLRSIRNSILHNHRVKRDKYWLIELDSPVPACSFLNYIFLNRKLGNLSNSERENIFSHEVVHARQRHTLDVLFAELVSVLFWFNPLMKTFKAYLTEVHEFLADENTPNNTEMKKSYSHLLLKLSTEKQAFNLSSGFSAKLIKSRIIMMDKARSMRWQKALFFLLLPAALALLMSFSYLENRSTAAPGNIEGPVIESEAVSQSKVGNISWEGNTVFSDSQLTKTLGIHTGDVYSKDYLNERLFSDEDAVNSLYLDEGYLFFQLEVKEEPKNDGTIDLTMSIYEGVQAKIGQIIITGNGKVPKQDIMDVLLIKKGELFSKTKLISSVRAIAKMKKFEPEKIMPNPIPKPDQFDGEYAVVDIEFQLTEK